jgi:hypothetical protein
MASTYPGGNESPRYDSNFVTRPGFGSAQYRPSWQRQYPPIYIGQVTAQPDDALPVYTVKEQCHNGNLTEFVDGRELSATEINGNITVPVGTYVVIEHMEGPTGFGAYFAFAEGGIVPAEGITVGAWENDAVPPAIVAYYPITSIIFGKDAAHTNSVGWVNWDSVEQSGTTYYPIGRSWTLRVSWDNGGTGGANETVVSSTASTLYFLNHDGTNADTYIDFLVTNVSAGDGRTDGYTKGDKVKVQGKLHAVLLKDAVLSWDATNKKLKLTKTYTDGSTGTDEVPFVNCITGT